MPFPSRPKQIMPFSSRDALAQAYFEALPHAPYPVQEEALLSWFMAEQGVMVCTPTGTGKTLIAHAALFEALHTGTTAYYTTPLIALTEQKFHEIQALAVRWGFPEQSVGLVTGHRRVNPEATILVVVAEILLNRLLHPEHFSFEHVSAVVMDEFHQFADPERGIVWELSLMLLPKTVRLLLLSATVGNAAEFMSWLDHRHGRKLELVEGRERKVPLEMVWVPDKLLSECLEEMAQGDEEQRRTPALVFCFNREECWSTAEQLKGLNLLPGPKRIEINAELERHEWTQGIGPKLRTMLARGVGVHHAGVLPKYRRMIEEWFTRKLLAVVVCTETLAAGINLPARSVVLTSLVKGPMGKQKLIDASSLQQIAGRAGRPQFDRRGYVFALAQEDDVKIYRWRQKYNQLPEKTGDPAVLKQKKQLERKKPSRRDHQLYWNEDQFKKLIAAPPGKLYSKGPLPWRLLAYLLKLSPDVEKIRRLVRMRLLDEGRIRAGEKALEQMLMTLHLGGFVHLEPEPCSNDAANKSSEASVATPPPPSAMAHALPKLDQLLVFRSIHPLYGAFLLEWLGSASVNERLQALESVLELPRSVLRYVRVPPPDELPPGPMETGPLHTELVQRGLIQAKAHPFGIVHGGNETDSSAAEVDVDDDEVGMEEDEYPPTLAEKLWKLFEARFPQVQDVSVQSVWCAGELFRFQGNFDKYVKARDLAKQEGILFRHLLRLNLLLSEFSQVVPLGAEEQEWKNDCRTLAEQIVASCRVVDPSSTDEILALSHAADVVEGEEAAASTEPLPPGT